MGHYKANLIPKDPSNAPHIGHDTRETSVTPFVKPCSRFREISGHANGKYASDTIHNFDQSDMAVKCSVSVPLDQFIAFG